MGQLGDHLYGGVYRRELDGSIRMLIPDRKGVGGMAFGRDDSLIVSGETVAVWNELTGRLRDVFSGHTGRTGRFFNDLTVDEHGSLYVGTVNADAANAGKEKAPPGDLYRVDPEGTSALVWEGIPASNGPGFSPDGKLLYHANSIPGQIWVYDVKDRELRDRRLFATVNEGWPDGLAVDAEGGVWIAAVFSGHIIRYRSEGTLDRKAQLPVKKVVSLVFGGPDLRELYVVTAQSRDQKGAIYRARSDIAGLPLPEARF